jgi:hypothetical protein
VVVFRAASQALLSPHLHDLGWGRIAKYVSVLPVPGAHGTLIHEPHVRVLAERVGAYLHGGDSATSE